MRRKLYITAIVAVVSSLLVAGTFAWTNFSAQIINQFFGQGVGDSANQRSPGGTLHNDFIESEGYRDVYIENWGTEPLIVRIHLSEYMEVGPGAGDSSASNEAVSLVEGALLSDNTTWTPFSGDLDDVVLLADTEASSFRDYWRWTMGGQKYFFPAPEDSRDNPDFVSTVSPPNLSPSALDTVKQTLNAEVISMDEWMSRGEPVGHYWVVDTDGFSYWAAPLLPDEATGLLLHRIDQVRTPVYDYFYALNVQGHMASIDDAPDNYERMLANASDNASRLINQLAGAIRSMDDEPTTMSFTIEEYHGAVGQMLELLYEDDQHRYYLSSMRANHIVLEFEDGLRATLRIALDGRLVTVADLIANGLDVIIRPRNGLEQPTMPFTIEDYYGIVHPTLQLLYEDDQNRYYLSSMRADLIILEFEDGLRVTLRIALDGGLVTMADLIANELDVIITPRLVSTPDAGTPAPGTPVQQATPPAPVPDEGVVVTPTSGAPRGTPLSPPQQTETPTPMNVVTATLTPPFWPDWTPTPMSPNEPDSTPTPFWPDWSPTPINPNEPDSTPTPFWPDWTPTPSLPPLDITPTPYSGTPTPTAWPDGGAMPSPTPVTPY